MTTPILCCGFECGLLILNLGPHWRPNAVVSIDTTTVRNGARSLHVNPTGSSGQSQSEMDYASLVIVTRFYIFFASLPDANTMVAFETTTGCGLGFKFSDSSLYAAHNTGTPVFGP